MAHRDFSTSVDEALKNRPSFALQGVEFLCKPALQWKTMASALNAIDTAGDSAEDLEKGLLGFFDIVLVKAARPKMRKLLNESGDNDDSVPVSMQQLTDVVRWLVEQYTGVPTSPSSESSDSLSETGEPSRADSSSTEAVASPV